MKGVEIALAQPATLDRNQARLPQLLDATVDVSLTDTHVFSESQLSRKATVLFPGIFEQHHVHELGPRGNLAVVQQEIRHQGVSPLGDDVLPIENNISIGAREC